MKDTFMLRAIELATQGVVDGHGGPFGAVIVKDGKVIGEGWNRVLGDSGPDRAWRSSRDPGCLSAPGHTFAGRM